MTEMFTRTMKSRKLKITYKVMDKRLNDELYALFKQLSLCDDGPDNGVELRGCRSISYDARKAKSMNSSAPEGYFEYPPEYMEVTFECTKKNGEYEPNTSDEFSSIMNKIFKLSEKIMDEDHNKNN